MGKKKIIQKSGSPEIKTATAVPSKPTVGSKNRIENGRIYVQASYNNTIITVTDDKGNVITWLSAGSLGFSGSKKSTPFAAGKVAEAIFEKIAKSGPFNVEIFVRGVGSGRDASVRSFLSKGLNIKSIRDTTPIPHNGPRPRKVRRV